VLTAAPSTSPDLPYRPAQFSSVTEGLDYAARGVTGCSFYGGRGELEQVAPYAVIRDRAVAIARRLIAMGFERGARIAIGAEMTPEFLCAFYACQYAGLLAVPLPVLTGLGGREGHAAQLRRIMETSGAEAAVGSADLLPQLKSAADGLPLGFIGTVEEIEAQTVVADHLRPLGPADLSHIQYSSGSTRSPSGIAISQAALMANAGSVARHGLELQPGDRCVSWLPLYHDMGMIGFMLIPMLCQISIDYLSTDSFARRPLQWLRIISRNRATVAFSPAFGYELCVRRGNAARSLDLDLSTWRVAGIGAEMIRAQTLDAFAETFAPFGFNAEAFVPSYGLAEATLAFSFAPLRSGVAVDHVDKRALTARHLASPAATPADAGNRMNGHRSFATCGRPLPGHKVEIRDENGAVLPDRHVGRIVIQGPSLMSGYFRDAEATEQVLTPDGWLDTGDMGYVVDGTLFVTGRRKDLIIVNGRNIWPQDLEWLASTVEEVKSRDTAAFSVEAEDGRETAVILVQCRLSDPELREKLRRDVRAVIFRNAGVDCRVALIPPRSLPFTSSGKLSRTKAKQAYLAGAYGINGDGDGDGDGTGSVRGEAAFEHGAAP